MSGFSLGSRRAQRPVVFSEARSYAAGDMVVRRGRLYRIAAPKPAGAWNGYKAEEVGDGDELRIAFAATGSIVAGPATLRHLRVLSGSSLTLTLRDSSNAAADTAIFTSAALSAATSVVRFGPRGYRLINGLYAAVTGTGIFEVGLTP